MTTKAVTKTIDEFVQDLLDKEFGIGKAEASPQGKIKFLFAETHQGCNEMEVGIWKQNKSKITIITSLDYVEALEYLRSGTKPYKSEIVALNPTAFKFPKPKEPA